MTNRTQSSHAGASPAPVTSAPQLLDELGKLLERISNPKNNFELTRLENALVHLTIATYTQQLAGVGRIKGMQLVLRPYNPKDLFIFSLKPIQN